MSGHCKVCYKQWYLILVGITYSVSYFYRNSIGPIADVLEQEFDTTVTYVAMLSSFLYATYCCMQIIVGITLEMFAFHICCLSTSLSMGIAMIVFSFSPNVTTGIIVRFISGFIVSFPFVTAMSMVSQLYGNHYVSTYSGLVFFCGNVLLFSMSYLQAFLYERYADWRSIYFYFGLFSIMIFVCFLVITIYEYIHQQTPLIIDSGDGFSEKSEIALKQSTDYKSLRTTCDSMDTPIPTSMPPNEPNRNRSFLHFITYRHNSMNRGEDSMIKSRMWNSLKRALRNKFNYILGIQAFCHNVILYAMNGLWVINYLMAKYDYSRESASIVSGLFFLFSGVGGVSFGKLGSIYPKPIVILTVCTVIMTIATIWFIYFTDDASFQLILTLSIINGIGCGGTTPIQYAIVREYNVGDQCEDTATGFVNVQRTSSGFIAQLLMGWMIDWHWNMRGGNDFDEHVRHYSAADYEFAFSLCTAALVVAIVTLIFLKEPNAKIVILD